MKNMKGIILAGGRATRLYPITKGVCKQLLPIYDKPMIYYPLSVLLLAGIKDILVITTPEDMPNFKKILGDGSQLGVRLQYIEQSQPRGLADAFLIGEEFIEEDNVCLILGDNVFYGDSLQGLLKSALNTKGATVFAYSVKDPQRYGVVNFNKANKVTSIEEKPKELKSPWAVTGIYFFDNEVVKIAKSVKPSKRGEIEITDVLKAYWRKRKLNVVQIGRGYAWLDTGTYESLIEASLFIKTIEERQGLKIGCIEEIAYLKGYISKSQLLRIADGFKTSYGDYLVKVANNF